MEKNIKHYSQVIKAYNKCPYATNTECTNCYIYKFNRKQNHYQDCESLYKTSIFKLNLNTWKLL